MTNDTVLFTTPTGSRLYGLAHGGSDFDTYTVVSELKETRRKNSAKHTIAGESDDFVIDFPTFMRHIEEAIPQALEAMFSPLATQDKLSSYRRGFRVSLTEMHRQYSERVQVESRGTFKRRRHALRWAINFREAVANGGYFNPVLSPEQAQWVNEMARSEEYIEAIHSVFPYEISLREDVIRDNIRNENNAMLVAA